MLVLGISAELGDVFALRRVVEIGEAGIVKLQIGAAELAQAFDLVGIDLAEVVPEFRQIRIDVAVDHRIAAAILHHAGRRDGQLRRARGDRRLEEFELLTEDAFLQLELAGDAERRRGKFDPALRIVELDLEIVPGTG